MKTVNPGIGEKVNYIPQNVVNPLMGKLLGRMMKDRLPADSYEQVRDIAFNTGVYGASDVEVATAIHKAYMDIVLDLRKELRKAHIRINELDPTPGHCKHGRYVGGSGADYMCHECEAGIDDDTE